MFSHIPETAFEKTDPIFRVIVHDHPRKYGFLQPPQASHHLAVSWRSDLIDPVIVTDQEAQAVWVGVDQRVACVSFRGSMLFSMSLTSSLIQIKTFEKFVLILCETQAIAVNRDHTLRRVCDLNDIPDAVDVKGDKLTVTSVDGETQTFPI